MKMMISCKDATKFILLKEERKLSLTNRLKLSVHFAICSLCKLFFKQNTLINKSTTRLQKNIDDTLSFTEKETMIDVLIKQP